MAADSSNDSSTSIPDNVPVTALSVKARTKLSRHLNYHMSLGKNWKDLADELEFTYTDICNMELDKDPTGELIRSWSGKEGATICALIQALQVIERFDVLTEVKDTFERDVDRWKRDNQPEQDPEITRSSLEKGEMYDAFVCYTEDDYPFVMEMMDKLERSRFPSQPPLRLCIEFRDILPGVAWTDAAVDHIGRKCKRMIVVLSPNFKGTPQCDFQTKFALALAPGTQTRRIVPIMYQECEVPEILAHLIVCNYTKKDLRPWFWDRLAKTLSLS